MLVTVIIPVYNSLQYVSRCLESVASQTYKDLEVIVIDDASTDGSCEMVKDICNKYDNFISVLHDKNIGLMAGWMEGLRLSNGEFVCFIDGDDYVETTYVEEMANKVIEYDVDMAMCNCWYDCRPLGKGLEEHRNGIEEGLYGSDKKEFVHKSIIPKYNGDYLSPSRFCKLIRKSIMLDNLKYCDPFISSAEDVNIMLPTTFSCSSFYYIEKPLLYYSQRQASISRKFRTDTLIMYNKLLSVLNQVISDKGLSYNVEIDKLYDLYGYAWCEYVINSNLNKKEKISAIRSLFDYPSYKSCLKYITLSSGLSMMIYKWSLFMDCPSLLICYKSLHKLIRG